MTALRPLLGLALAAAGCVAQDPAQTTLPSGWGPGAQQISGPPGGQMDPGYGYQQPDQPGYPQGYQDGYAAPSTEDQAAIGTAEEQPAAEPSADPNDAGYVMGGVSDTEIDATLEPYGTWEDNDDYGRVWRPNTTVVGVDFTPYESCGSWVWSDVGWNYSCDWGWGWLPFHYGRWGWFDGYWGWVPGHEWGPGWVDWRHGGGYVGWRPMVPTVRDHRGDHNTPTFHDHRTMQATAHDAHWRFAAEGDFGHNHIRGHLFQNPSEGLRVTQPVTKPSLRGNYAPVSSASLMRARLASNANRGSVQGGWRQPAQQPQRPQTWNRANEQPTWQRQQSFQRPQQQTWQRPQQQPTWQRPAQPQQGWRAPAQTYRPPQQTWHAPQQTYRPPQQTWHAPAQTYRPSAPTYHPSAPTYTPSHSTYSPPSHSSGGGGGGYHSSGGGGGGGSHSSGGGGGHSGGGGHHR